MRKDEHERAMAEAASRVLQTKQPVLSTRQPDGTFQHQVLGFNPKSLTEEQECTLQVKRVTKSWWRELLRMLWLS